MDNGQSRKLHSALGSQPSSMVAFQDLCLPSVATWLAAQLVTLVKRKSWKARMDPGWDPRAGSSFQV